MNNTIYLKFDWDTLCKERYELIDFPSLKEQILETIYRPNGWNVSIGETSKSIVLTISDEELFYYAFFGVVNEVENCFIVKNIETIFLPNQQNRRNEKMYFFASSIINTSVKNFFEEITPQSPVLTENIVKKLYSIQENIYVDSVKKLNVKKMFKSKIAQECIVELYEFPIIVKEKPYGKYKIYFVHDDIKNMLELNLETEAIEIGVVKKWQEAENRLLFQCEDKDKLPKMKSIKSGTMFLVHVDTYEILHKLKRSEQPVLTFDSKPYTDYRHDVKQMLKPILTKYNVKPNWSSSVQLFYYEEKKQKQQIVTEILKSFMDNVKYITVISTAQDMHKLSRKTRIKQPIDVEKFCLYIDTLQNERKKIIGNAQLLLESQARMNVISDEVAELQSLLKFLKEQQRENEKIYEEKKQKLDQIINSQAILKGKSGELEETKIFLENKIKEVQEQLNKHLEDEKQCKESLNELHLQLQEFKNSESVYTKIFKIQEKEDHSKRKLSKLEEKFEGYKKLSSTIDKSLLFLSQFGKLPFNEQLSKIDRIIEIDKMYKLTQRVDEMEQHMQQDRKIEENIRLQQEFISVEQDYNDIMQSLRELNIRVNTEQILAEHIDTVKLQLAIKQMKMLLQKPKKGIFTKFTSAYREWGRQLNIYFNQIASHYKYMEQNRDTLKNSQPRTKPLPERPIHSYILTVKNELYNKKYETVNRLMRENEIEIAEVYLLLFQFNRTKEELKASLFYFDDSLTQQTFKDKKSTVQIKLTQSIAILRDLTKEIERLKEDVQNYEQNAQALITEYEDQLDESIVLKKAYTELQSMIEKLTKQLAKNQQEIKDRSNRLRVKEDELSLLEDQLIRQTKMDSNIQYAHILQRFIEHEFLEHSNDLFNVQTGECELEAGKGVVLIENIEQLQITTLKQICLQADYVIGFLPVDTDEILASFLKGVGFSRKFPIIMRQPSIHDECIKQLIQYFYKTDVQVMKQPHYISTSNIRNDEYVTWLTVKEYNGSEMLENIFEELNQYKTRLQLQNCIEPKLRVQLFSTDGNVQQKIYAKEKDYAKKYDHLIFAYDEDVDLYIVQLSDQLTSKHHQLNHLKKLFLKNKPIVILSNEEYLENASVEPIVRLLKQFRRIKESSCDSKWTTSLKLR